MCVAAQTCESPSRNAAVCGSIRSAMSASKVMDMRARSHAVSPVDTSSAPGTLDAAHMDLLVAAYVFKLLSHVGYRPDFSTCVLCGDPMLSYFSAQAGGLMCGSCASSVPGAELVSAGEVAWLRALMAMTFDALMTERIDPQTAAFLLGLSHVWAATHTDQRLRAMEFMLGR